MESACSTRGPASVYVRCVQRAPSDSEHFTEHVNDGMKSSYTDCPRAPTTSNNVPQHVSAWVKLSYFDCLRAPQRHRTHHRTRQRYSQSIILRLHKSPHNTMIVCDNNPPMRQHWLGTANVMGSIAFAVPPTVPRVTCHTSCCDRFEQQINLPHLLTRVLTRQIWP